MASKKKWTVCGISNCARKANHKGVHSWERVNEGDHGANPLVGLMGELHQIQEIEKKDRDLGSLLYAAYVRNHPNHKRAKEQLARNQSDSIREMSGYRGGR